MDRRQFGVIEVERRGENRYALTINGKLWAEVEWSRSRNAHGAFRTPPVIASPMSSTLSDTTATQAPPSVSPSA